MNTVVSNPKFKYPTFCTSLLPSSTSGQPPANTHSPRAYQPPSTPTPCALLVSQAVPMCTHHTNLNPVLYSHCKCGWREKKMLALPTLTFSSGPLPAGGAVELQVGSVSLLTHYSQSSEPLQTSSLDFQDGPPPDSWVGTLFPISVRTAQESLKNSHLLHPSHLHLHLLPAACTILSPLPTVSYSFTITAKHAQEAACNDTVWTES